MTERRQRKTREGIINVEYTRKGGEKFPERKVCSDDNGYPLSPPHRFFFFFFPFLPRELPLPGVQKCRLPEIVSRLINDGGRR